MTRYFFIFILLLFHQWLLWDSALNDSLVMDEVFHIRGGYEQWEKKSILWNPPPVVRLIGTLFIDPIRLVDKSDPLNFRNPLDSVLAKARAPFLILFGFFGTVFFAILNRTYGFFYATIGLILLLFEPNLMAHGRYVTTDFPASLAFFVSLFVFYHFLSRPNGWRLFLLIASLVFFINNKIYIIFFISIFYFYVHYCPDFSLFCRAIRPLTPDKILFYFSHFNGVVFRHFRVVRKFFKKY